MTRFHFRLAPLVKLREAARDEKRALLADALRVEAELIRQRQEVEDELRHNRQAQVLRPGAVDVDRLLAAQRYEVILLARQQQIGLQLQNVTRELETRRAALVEADREVRVVEKLRETQWARHQAENARRTQNVLDDVAGQGHERRARQG